MLFPFPDGNTAEAVRDALIQTVQRLPDHLWLSLTWEGGQRVLNELIRTMTSAGHRIEPLETMEDTAIKLIRRRIAC